VDLAGNPNRLWNKIPTLANLLKQHASTEAESLMWVIFSFPTFSLISRAILNIPIQVSYIMFIRKAPTVPSESAHNAVTGIRLNQLKTHFAFSNSKFHSSLCPFPEWSPHLHNLPVPL
jgi:hypothetical protein